ncbi:VirB10/TraB/TrbI family type IV secretion system protein, partial [Klebsiella variicola]|uniref:VirB10/TraB/TrbI family type IV secretion system protein n=2 Tax=Klebsiella/Raoultella group TaxID=2890311 RepID=UPI0022B7892C
RDSSAAAARNPVRTRQQEMTQSVAAGQASETLFPGTGQQPGTTPLQPEHSPSPVRRIPYNPDLYVPENTAIPCSLDYRFVSDRAGKIRCTIADDIWSASGNTKLIEKGTTATGVYQTGAETGMTHGQGRAFLIITKLRTRQPPYLDIPLVDTRAAGELGEAGVDGWIDSHFSERFGGALLVGMIPDVAAWASDSAGQKDRNTDYTENSRQAMADMARTTLENSINIPPTLYKNQGELINLVTGQDIDFSGIYTLRMKNDR